MPKSDKLIKIVNGAKYSRYYFEGYQTRVQVNADLRYPKSKLHRVDIYTDETGIDKILTDLRENMSDNVENLIIVHTATVEQDEAASEILDELLRQSKEEE